MNCIALLALVCPSCDPEGMSLGQLDALFAAGSGNALPVGAFRGKVIYLDAKLPKVRMASMNAAWKGKEFGGDGSFINLWAAFKAVEARAVTEASWYDGRPAAVVDYAPGTPVFGNNRDEIREVAPGVWLGRFYERCPCGAFKGYFVLRAKCGCR
ncbi:MAG: hypothetical protein ACRC33_18790 [Gemmataceae bacterium]